MVMRDNTRIIMTISKDITSEEMEKLFYKDKTLKEHYTLSGNFKIELKMNNKPCVTFYATKINCYYDNKLHYIDLWKVGEFIATILPNDCEVVVHEFL